MPTWLSSTLVSLVCQVETLERIWTNYVELQWITGLTYSYTVLHHILKDFSKPGSAKNRYCHPGAPDPEKAILSCCLAWLRWLQVVLTWTVRKVMYKLYNKQLLVGCTTGAQLRLQRSVDKDVAGRHKTIAQPKSHWWGAKARPALGTVKRLRLNFWETLELLEFAIVFGDHSMLTAEVSVHPFVLGDAFAFCLWFVSSFFVFANAHPLRHCFLNNHQTWSNLFEPS